MQTTTLRTLSIEEVLGHVDAGAVLIDLRPIDAYLDAHVPGSLGLLYEVGPGMAARARDCLRLDLPLILLDLGHGDVMHAGASLRGKGFTVLGSLEDGINAWAATRGPPASTEVLESDRASGGIALDVGDPGAGKTEGTIHVPIELLWSRLGEFEGRARVVVVAGIGVRAALAVGMLERAGVPDIVFWKKPGSREAPGH